MKLLLATHNEGKAKELKEFLVDFGVEALSLNDLNINDDIEETGATFTENAILKANFFAKKTGLPTLADDSGIEIDALNGEPGVKSRRWKGYPMTDQELIDYTLERLKNVPAEKRTCKFVTVLALVRPNKKVEFGFGSLAGIITEKQMIPIQNGYPFRSIFYVSRYKKMLGELSPAEHAEANHRHDALKQLKPFLELKIN